MCEFSSRKLVIHQSNRRMSGGDLEKKKDGNWRGMKSSDGTGKKASKPCRRIEGDASDQRKTKAID